MAKRRKDTSRKLKRVTSGATGGPPTFRGTQYQIAYGVYRTIDLIGRYLDKPFDSFEAGVEVRSIGPGVHRWDLYFFPPLEFIEAKSNPKPGEIRDWVTQCAAAAIGEPDRQFGFVYWRGGGDVLASLEMLIRHAREAQGDDTRFRTLLEEEGLSEHARTMLSALGPDAVRLLPRMHVHQESEDSIRRTTERLLTMIADGQTRDRLVQFIRERLDVAAVGRLRYPIRDLITELTTLGIRLRAPDRLDARSISTALREAIVVLQAAKSVVPIEVLAAGASVDIETLLPELEILRQQGYASEEENGWSVMPLPAPIRSDQESEVLDRALQALIAIVKKEGKSTRGFAQIDSMAAVARALGFSHPKTVAQVFPTLDKLLKERGDKHFVLEVAYLSSSAAKRVRGDRETTIARARCEICGIAWVYQRVGQLSKAQAAAADARDLAERIGSNANIAYAEKCSGRLARVQAEGLSGQERSDKLAASVGHLHRAIDAFRADSEYGSRDPEVGDCHSLLARTHFVAGDLSACEAALTSAFEILREAHGKDYIDAMILRAEVFGARSLFDEARLRLEDAVSLTEGGGRELSEARARGLLARGRLVRRSGGDDREAAKDFKAADEIWTKLDEPELAADARWELRLLQSTTDRELALRLEKFRPVIRLKVADRIAAQTSRPRNSVAQRAQIPDGVLQEFVREAEREAALEETTW